MLKRAAGKEGVPGGAQPGLLFSCASEELLTSLQGGGENNTGTMGPALKSQELSCSGPAGPGNSEANLARIENLWNRRGLKRPHVSAQHSEIGRNQPGDAGKPSHCCKKLTAAGTKEFTEAGRALQAQIECCSASWKHVRYRPAEEKWQTLRPMTTSHPGRTHHEYLQEVITSEVYVLTDDVPGIAAGMELL